MAESMSHRRVGAHRALQQRDAFSHSPGKGVRVAQACCVKYGEVRQIPFTADREPALEQADGVLELSSLHVDIGEKPPDVGQGDRLVALLGDTDTLPSMCDRSLELSRVGEDH